MYRGLQGNPCNENRDPVMRTGFSLWELTHREILDVQCTAGLLYNDFACLHKSAENHPDVACFLLLSFSLIYQGFLRIMHWNFPTDCKIDWSYLMPWNSLTSFEIEEAFAITRLTNFAAILLKRHIYIRCSGEKTRNSIRWCYKNQIGITKSRTISPVCLLSFFRIGNFAIEITELFLCFLSNCKEKIWQTF